MSLEWEDTSFDMAALSFISELDQRRLKRVIVANTLQNEDIQKLQQLGVSKFGFVTSQVRSKAWLVLLRSRVKGKLSGATLKEAHADESQVRLDVNRAFSFVKDEERKNKLRDILYRTVVQVLREFPQLHYYQGYHEIVSVFVLTCSDESLLETVQLFTLLYLRDYMMDSLQCTIEQLQVLSEFITERDAELASVLQLKQTKPIFAIASILTILVHNFEHFDQDSPIFSVFDIIISSGRLSNLFVIYAELLLHFKVPILKQIEAYEADFENDMDVIHSVVQQTLLKLLTISSWDEILNQARLRLDNDQIKISKFVNKYSSLLEPSEAVLADELTEILTNEIEWNSRRSVGRALPQIPPIVKWSLIIGIIATAIKVTSSHSTSMHTSSVFESLRRLLST